ncbi:Aspartate aminotransferase, cytoplasmic [Physocladia obscura]|uniref:aspartate transaminase n=1 Tax=Physocladia obscura TaxID=109957 RepID=A0AAD5XIB2_9FUNG|nr:Aspartate aminotransferase, cytoplasmic [Physocladia obscura]
MTAATKKRRTQENGNSVEHSNKQSKTAGMPITLSSSEYSNLTLESEDSIFKLLGECLADKSPDTINLSVGAYRDNNGKPWVLPAVKKAKQVLFNDPSANHEYLALEGIASFNEEAAKLILGQNSSAIAQKRYSAIQTICDCLYYKSNLGQVIIAKVSYLLTHPLIKTGNHPKIFAAAGLPVVEYEYWNPKTRSLNYEVLLATLNEAPNGSIFVLHACAHNPTGLDPTHVQWKKIAKIMKSKAHFPFFDCAYQGFASGDLDKDAWAVRYFVEQGFDLLCAQSFSKNFGLYSERVGCLTGVFSNSEVARKAKSQFVCLVRCSISNAPGFGAKLVDIIFKDESLCLEWKKNLKEMSSRITGMREKVVQHLKQLETPGDWSHILSQIGMFSYTGLTMQQVAAIKSKFHVYMTDEGRISMAGLNEGNVRKFAEAVNWVVRNI